MPSQAVKDSTIQTTVIKYHSDTVRIKGDTITLHRTLTQTFDTVIKKNKTTLVLKYAFDTLFAYCATDSLNHIIDSLKETTISKDSFHSKIITQVEYRDVKVKVVPTWCWVLMILVLAYIALKIYIRKITGTK
jgi:hypothetical protein